MSNLKASIDFGLVHIPVEIINAEDKQDQVSFNLLDSRDNSRIRFKRVNENTGKEVEWEDIVKGFDVGGEKYVIFTDEELKTLEAESNKSLAIDVFVDKEEISPGLLENPYFLMPEKGGEKGYAILQKVLEKSGKYGVLQAVLRNKEQLGIIYAHEGLLMLDIIRYPHELKKSSEVSKPAIQHTKITDKELAMAERLLKAMSAKFNPNKYKDDYYSKVQTAIKNKLRSRKSYKPAKKEKRASRGSIDVIELLENSLKKGIKPSFRRFKAA